MADRPENEFEERTSPASGEAIGMDDLEDWFVREVLPLEAADTRALFKESHMVLDFRGGRDVGLGLFGRLGTPTLNGGVRFAQFSNKSSIDIQARPAVTADAVYETLFSGYISFPRLFPDFYQYHLQGTATRNFRGVGPSLSWNASADLLGNPEDGELTVDWGINAALLFGRQKAETSHVTETHHRYFTNPGDTISKHTMP